MDKVTLKIDGLEVTANKGTTILESALKNGIYIPNLCYHPDLEPVGVCRLCMVEIKGRGMAISCRTPVEEGLEVKTDSPEIYNVRRVTIELLYANHKTNCTTCHKNYDCELQRLAAYIGVEQEGFNRLRKLTKSVPLDTSNPFFDRDPNKCVLCGICVRTCKEILGVSAIDFASRGYHTTISTFADKPIAESRCVSCGECVVRCPVGALIPKTSQQPSWEVKTVCPYCGVGCGIYLGIRGNSVVNVRGDRQSPVNKGCLCVKGRFGFDFIHSSERLTTPLIKENGTFKEATWEETLDLVAAKLTAIKSDHGADSIGVLSSARITNEENYVAQKFARAVLKTNNIDHCARL
jgi:formate dehydrogenase alpha subunit